MEVDSHRGSGGATGNTEAMRVASRGIHGSPGGRGKVRFFFCFHIFIRFVFCPSFHRSATFRFDFSFAFANAVYTSVIFIFIFCLYCVRVRVLFLFFCSCPSRSCFYFCSCSCSRLCSCLCSCACSCCSFYFYFRNTTRRNVRLATRQRDTHRDTQPVA